jgi:ABC-2 type transport system ATP-binding protein
MNAPVAAISVRNLSKRYGQVTAVNDLSFEVAAGTTTALLGGNGAGKTTTISILLGVLLPSDGAVSVLGEDMLRHRYRVLPRMNFSSPYVDLPRRLTVKENLRIYGRLYALRDMTGRVEELGEALDLKAYQTRTRATFLMASHNMAEVERLCDDVIMLRTGKIVGRGTPQTLIDRYGRKTLEEVFLDIARGRDTMAAP